MIYEQGDIIVVPFPFSDLSSVKQRPVLILSKTEDINNSEDIITCAITSNLNNSKYSLIITNDHLEKGNIPIKSRIKLDKLFTIDKSIINKKVGRINKETLNKIKKEFNTII